jgi:hypothetical protein
MTQIALVILVILALCSWWAWTHCRQRPTYHPLTLAVWHDYELELQMAGLTIEKVDAAMRRVMRQLDEYQQIPRWLRNTGQNFVYQQTQQGSGRSDYERFKVLLATLIDSGNGLSAIQRYKLAEYMFGTDWPNFLTAFEITI